MKTYYTKKEYENLMTYFTILVDTQEKNNKDGFAKVILNGKWNFINTNGEFIVNKLFDDVDDFNDGYARVRLNDKFNFINTNGDFLSDQWFDYAYDFRNGFAIVQLNRKYNFINTNGEFISYKWFS